MIVDAHVHVASSDTDRFPRHPTGVGSDWWRNDASVESLLATLDGSGVDRAVVVQAVGVYGYDGRCAAAAVKSSPHRLALVAAIDMDVADPAAALDAIDEHAPVRGVRLFGVRGNEPHWLVDGRAAAVWERAAELGLCIVPTVFPPHLEAIGELAERRPDVPVAVDHCGFVDPADAEAMGRLLALASLPSVNLKISSYVLSAADKTGDPAAFIDTLATQFDVHRLCWGSDHPQHQGHTYAQKLDLARRAARNLDEDGRDQLFAGTALRLWWR